MTADRTPAPDTLTDATCPCGHRARLHILRGRYPCLTAGCPCRRDPTAALLASPEHAAFVAGQRADAQAEVANAFVAWAASNEIAQPPLDWAWFGEITRRYSPLHEGADRADAEAGRP